MAAILSAAPPSLSLCLGSSPLCPVRSIDRARACRYPSFRDAERSGPRWKLHALLDLTSGRLAARQARRLLHLGSSPRRTRMPALTPVCAYSSRFGICSVASPHRKCGYFASTFSSPQVVRNRKRYVAALRTAKCMAVLCSSYFVHSCLFLLFPRLRLFL